jgi:hypothetical protein
MHTKDFMQCQYNVSDMLVKKINFAFLNDFEYYLRSVRSCVGNSVIKYIKNLGKIVRICLRNGWLNVDPYLNYMPKQKAVHREVLTKEELKEVRCGAFKCSKGHLCVLLLYGPGLCGCTQAETLGTGKRHRWEFIDLYPPAKN